MISRSKEEFAGLAVKRQDARSVVWRQAGENAECERTSSRQPILHPRTSWRSEQNLMRIADINAPLSRAMSRYYDHYLRTLSRISRQRYIRHRRPTDQHGFYNASTDNGSGPALRRTRISHPPLISTQPSLPPGPPPMDSRNQIPPSRARKVDALR